MRTWLETCVLSARLAAQGDEEQQQDVAEAQEALVPAYPQFPGLLQELGAQCPQAGHAGAQQSVLSGAAGREGLQGER